MNYQSSLRKMGTMENIRMITDNLDARARSAVDIGCDAGAYSAHFAHLGLKVDAHEPDDSAVAEATRFLNANHAAVKLHHQLFTLEHVKAMPVYDVVSLLSVYHQIAERNGLDYANDYLVGLYRKARHQFFFQSCMIHLKHGCRMPFIENHAPSILEYFTSVLRASGEPVHARMLGFSQNGLPASEPFRPMFLFEKSKDRKPFVAPSMERGGYRGERPCNLLHIEIDHAVSDQTLQSFSPTGWHYFTEACGHLARRDSASLGDARAALDHYYDRFQPKTFGEIWRASGLDGDIGVLANQPTGHYCSWMPWNASSDSAADMRAGRTVAAACPTTDRHTQGPLEPGLRVAVANRLNAVFEKMRTTGYEPEVNLDGYIRGQLLVSGDQSRFVVLAGQHRLAALSALGCRQVIAKFQHGRARVIDRAEAATWPQVANGTYTLAQALTIFDGVFAATGLALRDRLRVAAPLPPPAVAAVAAAPTDGRHTPAVVAAREARDRARETARQQAATGQRELAIQTLVRAAKQDLAANNPWVILESLVNIGRDLEPLDAAKAGYLLREAEKIAARNQIDLGSLCSGGGTACAAATPVSAAGAL